MSNYQHIIQLKADGHIVSGLSIHETHDGERGKDNVLKTSGGVEFVTQKGKHLFLQFHEFSFVFNPTEATQRRAA